MISPAEFFVAVPEDDSAEFNALSCDFPVGYIGDAGTISAVRRNNEPVTEQQISNGLIGAVAFSQLGLDVCAQFGAVFETLLKVDEVPLLDLSAVPARKRTAKLQAWIVARFLSVGQTWSRRNVDLMRGLVRLRDEHARTQARFAALEKFVAGLPNVGRTIGLALRPDDRLPAIDLPDGGILEQRIPLDGAGLCDVAISLLRPLPEGGQLFASLHTLEDGETAAAWCLPRETLAEGELRFTLPAALEPDSRTAALRLA